MDMIGFTAFTVKFFGNNGVNTVVEVNSEFVSKSNIMTDNVNNLYGNRLIIISYNSNQTNVNEIMATPVSFDEFYKKRIIEIDPSNAIWYR